MLLKHRAITIAFCFTILFFLSNSKIFAQNKTIKYGTQSWIQYYLNAKIHKNFSLHFDAGYRRQEDFVAKPLTWLARCGLTFHASKKLTITGGYAYFASYVENPTIKYFRNESRPYLRIGYSQKHQRLQIIHRYRIELRNLQAGNNSGPTSDYISYLRHGYQLNLQYPLIGTSFGKGIPFISFYDELFLNTGSEAPAVLDQNRIYLGAGYGVSNQIAITIGYQYIYQQRNKYNFESINSVRFNILHNIDLRKAEVANIQQ